MENQFRVIVEHIFNNWTGLQLAIQHGMGGPDNKKIAAECIDYMTNFCLHEPHVQVNDIREALEDIMDEEFETVCEDNSPNEIANLLYRFASLLKEGNVEQCELEYHNLPTCKASLSKPQAQPNPPQEQGTSSHEEEVMHEPMEEEDPGWTKVRSHRKR